MSKNKVSRLAFIVFMGMTFLLTGCGKRLPEEDAYRFYNLIQVGQTRSEVEAALEVIPEESNNEFTYVNEDTGFGVTITYDASNKVTSKIIYNADEDKIIRYNESEVNEDQKASIVQGMTYEEVTKILGSEGLEIGTLENPLDKTTPIYVMMWMNKDKTGYFISFVGKKGTVSVVEYY
jgi:hypothetical protein